LLNRDEVFVRVIEGDVVGAVEGEDAGGFVVEEELVELERVVVEGWFSARRKRSLSAMSRFFLVVCFPLPRLKNCSRSCSAFSRNCLRVGITTLTVSSRGFRCLFNKNSNTCICNSIAFLLPYCDYSLYLIVKVEDMEVRSRTKF
jgi:hypothetical protein